MTLPASLSKREMEVVELLRQGKSNKLIALALGITERTVEFHLTNIYAKFQVSSRMELILSLENATGHAESEKLGVSTVDEGEKNVQDSSTLDCRGNWMTSFKEALPVIGRKLEAMMQVKPDAGKETINMTFFESVRVCLTKYAEFNGRATRPEFWWFALFVLLVTSGLTYASEALGSMFLVATLLPLLAVGARRLHDIGRSAWWLLYLLVPVGGLVLLVSLWALPPQEMASLSDDTTLA